MRVECDNYVPQLKKFFSTRNNSLSIQDLFLRNVNVPVKVTVKV